VKHYYDVEAEARQSGNADLIETVTFGRASLASQNFHAFIAEQTSLGRHGVVLHNYYRDWHVAISGVDATVMYTFWLTGHDTDLSGKPIETDNTTTRGTYRMRLQLVGARWLAVERDLLKDNVP
jgi:hypothetical protein